MYRACSIHGKDTSTTFYSENLNGGDVSEGVSVDERIVLKK
jgi:hypothetical protein